MAYKLIVSPSAERDMSRIVQYLAEELANPDAAAHFADELLGAYTKLADNPLAYAISQDRFLAGLGIRHVKVLNYLIAFAVEESEGIVKIMRVFHETQDWTKYL